MKYLLMTLVALAMTFTASAGTGKSCDDCCKGKCAECCKGDCKSCCKK